MRRMTALWVSAIAVSGTAVAAVSPPVVQWVWDGDVRAPGRNRTCATPFVAQLTDDNGDSRIDAADTPDVFFTACQSTSSCDIVVLDGATGNDHFTIQDPLFRNQAVAVGDIDGDGIVEFVGVTVPIGMVVALEHTGALKWTSTVPTITAGGTPVAIADLDQDGSPEIIAGPNVYDAFGGHLWTMTAGVGGFTHIINVADVVAAHPGLEVLAGRTLYGSDGVIVWDRVDLADGWTAIADFDGDGDPEIVFFEQLQERTDQEQPIHLLDHMGVSIGTPLLITTHTFPGSRLLSPPVVADFDGDGQLGVLAAYDNSLLHVEWNGTAFQRRWDQRLNAWSGYGTGSAYDFDGDGASEVLFRDDEDWFLLDGGWGQVISQIPFESATVIESPSVADIDNDCLAEILVSGCKAFGPGAPGVNSVIAYEVPESRPARAIWNQYTYHVTNVNDDGSIPVVEPPSWQSNNSWQGQVEEGRPSADAGDDVTVCAGSELALDGTASLPCAGSGLEYRWLEAGVEVCAWSSAPSCVVAPSVDTVYTLEVRCLSSPATCLGGDDVAVIIEPEVVPPDLGNSLRAVQQNLDVSLSWGSVAEAKSHSLYRGRTKGVWPTPPYREWLSAPREVLPDIAGPSPLYYYRAAAASCSGQEGP